MRPFDYIVVKNVQEAICIKAEYGSRARFLAGGTDLLGLLKDDLLEPYPEVLVNIKPIEELQGIEEKPFGIIVGPVVTLSEITRNSKIKETYSLLAQAAKVVGSPQIRNIATIGGNILQEVRCWYFRYPQRLGGRFHCLRRGGNICYAVRGNNRYHAILRSKGCVAVCPSDMAVVLTTLEAKVILKGKNGERTLKVEDLYTPIGIMLYEDEILAKIIIPSPPEGARQVFYKFALRRPIDFAVVSVAVLIKEEKGIVEEARITLGAIGHKPFRVKNVEEWLKGKPLDPQNIDKAANLALKNAKALRHNAYKIDIARALIKRTLLGQL